MDEARNPVSLVAEEGLFGTPVSSLPAPAASAPAASSASARLVVLLTLEAGAFAALTASGKIPAVVLALFRALLTF
jgi:hypothetical protein